MKQAPAIRVAHKIAREILGIPTLETRHGDGLDFYQVAVWKLETALVAAYAAGLAADKLSARKKEKVNG